MPSKSSRSRFLHCEIPMPEAVEDILRRIPIWRGDNMRGIEEIQGGWTNRNYKIDLDRGSYVLRLKGEGTDLLGIDREQEHRVARLAGEAGVAPRVVYCSEPDGIMVTEYFEGKHFSRDEAAQPESIERLALTLRKIHSLRTACAPFCPFQRAIEWLRTASQCGVNVPDEFASIADRIQPVRDSAYSHSYSECLCHNDLALSNILDHDGLKVVDWEHAGTGNPLFDLASLAVNAQLPPGSERLLLAAYFEKGQAPHEEALRARRCAVAPRPPRGAASCR